MYFEIYSRRFEVIVCIRRKRMRVTIHEQNYHLEVTGINFEDSI
jgi:hypothetical protein